MPVANCAVMLLAFGGPESLDLIEPFLEKIMRGRRPTPEQVKDIRERYRAIGGKSPLNEITKQQAEALQKRIEKTGGLSVEVFVGMRYWQPYIKDTLSNIINAGFNKVIAIIMAPHRSGFTEKGYRKEIETALDGFDKKPEICLISDFFSNSYFQRTIADKIRSGVSSFTRGKTVVIFSAHSLPLKFITQDDPYEEQIKKTIEGVVSITGPLNWKLGYQSKGLMPGEWLGPSVDSILEDLPDQGFKNVLIVPIGFVADHVETLYDIDIVYRKKSESLGLCFNRSESLNDSPGFIEALNEIVMERINE